MMKNQCDNCGGTSYIKKDGNTALSSWYYGSEGEPILDIGTFIPVQVYFCESCDKMHMFYHAPEK